jgi:hypothetical protein
MDDRCRAHIGEFWRAGIELSGAGFGRVITCQPRACHGGGAGLSGFLPWGVSCVQRLRSPHRRGGRPAGARGAGRSWASGAGCARPRRNSRQPSRRPGRQSPRSPTRRSSMMPARCMAAPARAGPTPGSARTTWATLVRLAMSSSRPSTSASVRVPAFRPASRADRAARAWRAFSSASWRCSGDRVGSAIRGLPLSEAAPGRGGFSGHQPGGGDRPLPGGASGDLAVR